MNGMINPTKLLEKMFADYLRGKLAKERDFYEHACETLAEHDGMWAGTLYGERLELFKAWYEFKLSVAEAFE